MFIYFNLGKQASPYWLQYLILFYINKLAFTKGRFVFNCVTERCFILNQDIFILNLVLLNSDQN